MSGGALLERNTQSMPSVSTGCWTGPKALCFLTARSEGTDACWSVCKALSVQVRRTKNEQVTLVWDQRHRMVFYCGFSMVLQDSYIYSRSSTYPQLQIPLWTGGKLQMLFLAVRTLAEDK